MATLLDYIEFLRKNGLYKEARFYFTEVPELLKYLGYTKTEVLEMRTQDVLKGLYFLKDTLDQEVETFKKNKKFWDVELHGNARS